MSPDSILFDKIRCEGMVVFAGAGLSMAAPTSLPGWFHLNELIFDSLCACYEQHLNKPDYLTSARAIVKTSRQQDLFPPDYQAQLLHEYCGDDYFRLLQSVDVSVTNENHDALAQLVAAGQVKAIITTNFDRLIEQSLSAHGIAFNVAFDAASYESCFRRMINPKVPAIVDVIKIHGCVQDHLSLVDTLKQRLLGRNRFLEACITQLLSEYIFLYAGFSARDLESDPDYLGLIKAASQSPGFIYVQWPGASQISKGAAALMSTYGNKSHLISADTVEVFRSLQDSDWSANSQCAPPAVSSVQFVEKSLAHACQRLGAALVSTCLAAVMEANGYSRGAYDILHAYWRVASAPDQTEPGFLRFRLLHGRLGVGLGQVDTFSHSSNSRREDSLQNLLRVREQDRRADAWTGLAMVWQGRVEQGYYYLISALAQSAERDDPAEHRLDCWFALAEYTFFSREGVDAFDGWQELLLVAENCADLARQARVAAMVYLHLCDKAYNIANADQTYQQLLLPRVFSRSERLNDPVSQALTALARARWFNHQFDAESASEAIDVAMQKLSQAGMVRWYEFARIERSKNLLDQERLDDAAHLLEKINVSAAEHALLQPRFFSAHADLHRALNNPEGTALAYHNAAAACERLGMNRWRKVYEKAAADSMETMI